MEGQETDKSVCFLNAWTEQYHWMKGWKTSLISGHEFVEYIELAFLADDSFFTCTNTAFCLCQIIKSFGHNARFFFYILFRICKRVRRSLADINICLDITDITGMKTEKKHYFNIIWILRHCKIIKTIFFFDICLVKFDFTWNLRSRCKNKIRLLS